MGTIIILYIALSSLSINFRNRKLIYRAWMPFDYTSTVSFCLTYIYQFISLIVATFVTIGCDTLICGLLIHICCQFEILTYRLREIISYSDVLRDCILQHYHIFRFAFIIKTKLSVIIANQFIMTTVILSFSLYQIDKTTTIAKYFEMILCILFILTEIFLYCWCGNEVKIKSYQMVDNIFQMEWMTLDKNRKKSLMIIMTRALVPIQITCAYLIPVNLNSFMGFLKMSYSTYNLFQQMRQ
ncbi:odorant receptor 94a [Monomorium pharaonis]|uniref:odorant receptor 94a n=1 Tax=Monomorium pharaonis TaxID=307658 RepID=UPI0017472E06|nr:odorant receptor 94a [Monomorium pharaonis]